MRTGAAHRRAPWLVVAILCLGAVGGFCGEDGPAPDPEAIRTATQTILSQNSYDLDKPERFQLDLSRFWRAVGHFLETLFEPLGTLGFPVTIAIVVALVIVLIGLLSHIVYSFYSAIRTKEGELFTLTKSAPVDPSKLEAEAVRFAAQGNFVDASRMLYAAALAMLEQKRESHVKRGLTNTEYLRTFRTAWVTENLRIFVDLINWKWYRDRMFEEADYQECRQAYDRLQARLKQESECSTQDTQASASLAS